MVLEIASETDEVLEDFREEEPQTLREVGIMHKMSDKPLLAGKTEVAEKTIDGRHIKFTNLNKLYWPEDGITKREMFNYYDQVAPYMVPYLLTGRCR